MLYGLYTDVWDSLLQFIVGINPISNKLWRKSTTYDIYNKIEVNSENAHAHSLYSFLKKKQIGILTKKNKWNFTKFLIDQNGHPVNKFRSLRKSCYPSLRFATIAVHYHVLPYLSYSIAEHYRLQ